MSAIAQAGARLRLRPRFTAARRRWRRPLGLTLLAVAALAALFLFWFRDSGLVGVRNVEVHGIPGDAPQAAALERALQRAGREMTTLHVQPQLLESAARPFGLVRSVDADAGFPDSLSVHVVLRRPAAIIGSGPKATVVAGDGTMIRSLDAEAMKLPRMPADQAPDRRRLRGGMLEQAAVLGAAPPALRPYLDHSSLGASGVVVTLRGGVELRFGAARSAGRKWRAAAAVLSDPDLTALDYVDLSSPGRPAVGGAGHLLAPAP